MVFSQENFNKLIVDFEAIYKTITRKNASKNHNTRKIREHKIINVYNGIVEEYNAGIEENIENKEDIERKLLETRESLTQCLEILESEYETPIDRTKQIIIGNILQDLDTSNDSIEDIEDKNKNIENKTGETNNVNKLNMEKIDFLKFAGQQIKDKYGGDPLELESFINSIELVKGEMETHEQTYIKFLLTRIVGKALECIPKEPNTVDEITNALKRYIKPDSSKIIEGKMLSLKANKNNITEYTKQAEELAEALQRSLIVEGISQNKAREMSIDRTVEMCRTNARTDIVKSILASTTFENPKEAIAKFVVETNKESTDKQIFAFRSNFRQNNRRGFGSYNGNRPFNRNFSQNFRQNRPNHFNNRNNFGNRNSYNNNNYNNNRGRFNTHRGNNYNNNNSRNTGIRVVQSENLNNPQSLTLGATDNWRSNQGVNNN